ncbi:hypothetical protein TWF569_011977 [Orbilia oligospora]|nr:hypothetical protein TWF706_012006 [Orbilia oligospora]KAF3123031.1 hypothetical protein TWF594_011858 [Orbilia oligospora]KAF3137688.1 hypothetical protein TWF569_011977 [Orbilia oligospora]
MHPCSLHTHQERTHGTEKEAKDKNSANVKVSRSLFRSGQEGWGFERREMKRLVHTEREREGACDRGSVDILDHELKRLEVERPEWLPFPFLRPCILIYLHTTD